MNNLDLLRLSEQQDVEAFESQDFEEETPSKNNKTEKFKEEYSQFYDDIKQPSKYIKEDW